jgi:hypothetical protein
MKTITSVLALAIALFTRGSPAFADDVTDAQKHTEVKVNTVQTEQITPAHAAPFTTSHAGVTADIWPARHTFTTVLRAELQLRVSKKLFIDLSYAGAYARIGGGGEVRDNFAFGNPTVGMHIADSPTRSFSYMLGASITAPLLQDPSVDIGDAATPTASCSGTWRRGSRPGSSSRAWAR